MSGCGAQARSALGLSREVGDLPGEAAALTNLGAVYGAQSRYTQAVGHHQRAFGHVRVLRLQDHAATGSVTGTRERRRALTLSDWRPRTTHGPVERVVERAVAATLCIRCFPGTEVLHLCRQSARTGRPALF
jgi:hypothetical protein